MNTEQTRKHVERVWAESILPALTEYIRIPCLSAGFDPDWERHGYLKAAVSLAREWVDAQGLERCRTDVLELPGRTPLLLIEVDGTAPGTVMLYGHLDKQPAFDGWREEEGIGPFTPVLKDGKLYGRGGADDGYAVFATVAAISALQDQGAPTPRLVALIECSEESGSPDLPAYMDYAKDRIGTPDLVVCLDSGCGDYERLWNTTSLRGFVGGELSVSVLSEGFHSGDASGIVPSSFRVLRLLLDRLEDARTGTIIPESLHVPVPEARLEQAREAAQVLHGEVHKKFPLLAGVQPMSNDQTTLVLNRTWRPALSVTGAGGMPPIADAGNVLRPKTSLKLSLRIPPGLDPDQAMQVLRELLESDPPYGAKVKLIGDGGALGWQAPEEVEWLRTSIDSSSRAFFDNPPCSMGEGGSIPFMALLGERFPKAQFLITGVLGPKSNAHGPNEFLHLGMAKGLTCCVAHVIADAAANLG